MFLLKNDFNQGRGPVFAYKYHYANMKRVGIQLWFTPQFDRICWKQ